MLKLKDLYSQRNSLERQLDNCRNDDKELQKELDDLEVEIQQKEVQESLAESVKGMLEQDCYNRCIFPMILNCRNCPAVNNCKSIYKKIF